MPRVQFVDVPNNICVTRNMLTPKRITDINAWMKSARKALPQLDAYMSNEVEGWYIHTHDVDATYVKFDIRSRGGNKAHVIIDRRPKFGD